MLIFLLSGLGSSAFRRAQDLLVRFLPRGAGGAEGDRDGGLAQVNRAGCFLEIHLLEDVSHAPPSRNRAAAIRRVLQQVAKRCVDGTSDAIADFGRSVRLS